MKRFLLTICLAIGMCAALSAEDLINTSFDITEYRWGNGRYDFHCEPVTGNGYIHLDDEGSGVVQVTAKGRTNTFYLNGDNITDIDDDDDEAVIYYRYGNGEVSITISRYSGLIIFYSVGDTFKVWKQHP